MQDYFHLSMERQDINAISAQGLAHIGDCVFELMVRSYLCLSGRANSTSLHKATVALVTAPAQARQMERIMPLLTEEELAVFKRGRNAHTHAAPKSATSGEYARATGLECLFGALYLAGKTDRLNELFDATVEEPHAL